MGNFKKIRFSLIFNRKGKLNRFGEALIQIEAYQNRKYRYFSTDIYVEPRFWDTRNLKVKYNHPNEYVLNQQIQEQLHAMEAFQIKMINRMGGIPIERLDEYVFDSRSDNEAVDFTSFYQEELKHHRVKPSSRKMYQQTFNKLIEFRKTIYFEDISYSLVVDFDRFLHKKGLSANTVKKHHHRLKTFILQAIKKGLVPSDNNPYRSFKVKGVEPERVVLTVEELERIENLVFDESDQKFVKIREIFVLAVYTGLRFSDVTGLTAEKISRTSKGLELHLKAEKTGKPLTMPLYSLFREEGETLSKPEKIIYKYLKIIETMDAPGEADRIPFFKITNQYLNRALKELAAKAGIRKRVTSHVARRTFATIMATKVKKSVIQRLLQHSRSDMTDIYVQLSNQMIETELKKVDWNNAEE